jgi:hypothetical protein
MTGKGSKARPFSVSQQEYDTRWDAIFQRDIREEEDQKNEDDAFNAISDKGLIDNTGTSKDEFYDVLTTEDCLMVIYKD